MQDRPLEDWEYPDEGDDSEDDSVDTYACPKCGTQVYEDAVACPVCGHYLTRPSTSPLSGKPGWYVALLLLIIVVIGLSLAI